MRNVATSKKRFLACCFLLNITSGRSFTIGNRYLVRMSTDSVKTSLSSSSTPVATPQLVVSLRDALGAGKIRLILASQSPRRREILDMMGLALKYDTIPSPLDETALQLHLKGQHGFRDDEGRTASTPQDYTRILAEEKARALAVEMVADAKQQQQQQQQPTLVLGSDTIVELSGEILEKPVDTQDARRMLKSLSGNVHTVHTGVAVYRIINSAPSVPHSVELFTSFTDSTTVRFAHLSDRDIEAYVATGEPMDKAGAYGIQGIGGQLVCEMDGDYFTVMGMPMHRTSVALCSAIVDIHKLMG